MKPTITVFTPTYNRKQLLSKCYESLRRQSNKNFIWLIVDDGSTDQTNLQVENWKNNIDEFKIDYIYKANGGLHTAYNEAIKNIDTELCVCVDSDDFMPDNAIELILNTWDKKRNTQYAGIIGLDYYTNGEIVGDILPGCNAINLNDMLINKVGKGDKKIVVRTELYKEVAPMKTFNNEKHFNPNYLNTLISEKYDFIVLNKNLCFVEYQPNGMSSNIYKQYLDSPNSYAEMRRLYMSLSRASFKFRIRNAIHYNSSCIIAKKYKDIIKESPNKLLTTITIPLGSILTFYIKAKNKQIISKN